MAEEAEWEIVKIVGTTEEATIVVGFLQSSGIESEAESLHSSEFPADMPEVLKATLASLVSHEDQELAQRAIYHLYQLVTRCG